MRDLAAIDFGASQHEEITFGHLSAGPPRARRRGEGRLNIELCTSCMGGSCEMNCDLPRDLQPLYASSRGGVSPARALACFRHCMTMDGESTRSQHVDSKTTRQSSRATQVG